MTWNIHRVEKRGALFYVIGVNGRAIGRGYAQREEAEQYLDALLRSAQKRVRICISCQKPFESEGSHNRRCNRCKSRE